MQFRIADTFTDSLARLTGDEQKAVKTTTFDLMANAANPGMAFHKLDRAKDKNFWSVRVSADIRIIVHRTVGSLLLCYVDHHDRAYYWAERRKLEVHPATGAAQFVEIRETVKEVVKPLYVPAKPVAKAKRPLAEKTDDELLAVGVPPAWLNDVRTADEDSILAVAERLPSEAGEAILELAIGGRPSVRYAPASKPQRELAVAEAASPFDHPDALRRFRVIANREELQRALDFPWEKWTVFLHPDQRDVVERAYNGPARVSGSAGTGKTVVALHRAVHLARKDPEGRVLLATFSDPLARALNTKLRRLIGNEPRLGERVEVYAMEALGTRLYKPQTHGVKVASAVEVREIVRAASKAIEGHKFTIQFLLTEWDQVVDAWQLQSWEGYRDVARLGRKTRLPEPQRAILWSIFERVRAELSKRKLITNAAMFTALAESVSQQKHPPFDFAVIDEAQDLSIAQLQFLAALGGSRRDALFFAGDLGQRIFQQPFSWKSLGVDIRGRSRTLRVNYRTSHQIRQQCDRLLGPEITDVDGNADNRADTVSVFNGPPPDIRVLLGESAEIEAVATWLREHSKAGVVPHEIGVFVRSKAQLERATSAVQAAGLQCKVLDDLVETVSGHVAVSTMHLAKGLEFRAMVVMACDDEVIPLQERIETVGDEADLKDVYETERHLLYVACTRARDYLLITATDPASEFLEDLRVD